MGGKNMKHNSLLVVLLATMAYGAPAPNKKPYLSENVIIAVMDGTHYDRTFGDPEHRLIPHLWNDLRPLGTSYTNFYNNSVPITKAGHSNIMTGNWQYNRNRRPLHTDTKVN